MQVAAYLALAVTVAFVLATAVAVPVGGAARPLRQPDTVPAMTSDQMPLDERVLAWVERMRQAGRREEADALQLCVDAMRQAWQGSGHDATAAVGLHRLTEFAGAASTILARHWDMLSADETTLWVFTAAQEPVGMPAGSTAAGFLATTSNRVTDSATVRINGHPVPADTGLANGDLVETG